MLRILFLLVPFLLLVHVTSAVALPPCNGDYTGLCHGTHIRAGGSKYVGEFRDGRYHGHGTYTAPNYSRNSIFGRNVAGLVTVGEFVDNFPNGNVTIYWGNGDVWVGRIRSSHDGEEWLSGNKYTADSVPPDLVKK